MAIIPLLPGNAFAGTVTINWTAPSVNTDGTTINDLSGYNLYYGPSPDNYPDSINAGNVTSYQLSLPDGYYCFAVSSYDIAGYESEPSASICGTVWSQDYQAPVIDSFTSDVVSGSAPLTLSFSASAYDPDGTVSSYQWDFNGDGTYDLDTGTTPYTDHTYSTAGSYTARLKVVDNQGHFSFSSTILITVQSAQNQTPVIDSFTSDAVSGSAPLTVSFSASAHDPDGTVSSYQWDFNGDGTYDLDTGTIPYTDHTYSTAGSYTARLKIVDNSGNFVLSGTISITVQSDLNELPVISSFDANIMNGTVPLTVMFLASASDPDGSISSYLWDFDGDGTYDLDTGTSSSAEYTYSNAGTYIAKLKVVDNSGGFTISNGVLIAVQEAGSGLPTINSFNADTVSGAAPLTVTFSASASDPDGSISSYRWDFDGDGTYDQDTGSVPSAAHTYTTAGTYTARLKVLDDSENSAVSRFISIFVQAPAIEMPVIDSFTADIASGTEPLTVSFTVSADDPDGYIVSYFWDFDGDGVYDESSGTDPFATHTYTNEGTYIAKVKVTDDAGNSIISGGIDIVVDSTTNTPPSLTLVADPDSGVAPLSVSFVSNAVDTDGQITTYEWDFDGDGVFELTTYSNPVYHVYDRTGTYTARVRITDNNAATAIDEISITVKGVSSQPYTPPNTSGVSGCFIATAAYGSYLDSHVQALRGFRDRYLLTNPAGTALVNLYYASSPPIANFIARHGSLRVLTRVLLTPIILGVEYPVPFFLIIVSLSVLWYSVRRRSTV